ncbi:MAG: 3-deoxy-8-phosphooctulonate synthase [Bacteroidales bacterium]|nr:3-deoxy-8-phosphooctulonate synthase [Bacteroidales bacterium]
MIPDIPKIQFQDSSNFFLIAGPCVVESREVLNKVAARTAELSAKYSIPLIFKASYRKANRSRIDSFSGLGDTRALEMLAETAAKHELPLVTDIHNPDEASIAAEYVDILQIPAFLCRQTDLLIAAAKTGKWVNIKKGQFLSGESMGYAVEKVRHAGNNNILLTERGNMFGYTDMVVDMTNIPAMKKTGVPVIMDITHSLQKPNQPGGVTGGDPEMIAVIGRAAIAAGADGIFLETHPDPSGALSDGANMLHLDLLDDLLYKLTEIRKIINKIENEK